MATTKRTGQFGAGNPGKPKGATNKSTRVLKDAILLAAEGSGQDKKGKGGLVGYLRRVADEDVKAFSGLLGRVLPLQITGDSAEPLIVKIIKPDA